MAIQVTNVFFYSILYIAKIIIGSLQGVLRIFSPTEKGYKAEDSLLEQNLEKPILQLAVGNFVPYIYK